MDKEELKYWLALNTNLEIGARTFQKLLAQFDSLEDLWCKKERLTQDIADSKILQNVQKVISEINPDAALKKVEKMGLNVVTIKDKEYPKLLGEIPDLPALLYYLGKLQTDDLTLAVVGSRKYTGYGRVVCEQLVGSLVDNGLAIVSGLALGIDGIAHRAALDKKARTIAVLANGLDKIYPTTHEKLAAEIIEKGGVILSEYPPGVPAFHYNFPVRNRIIAGLSLGTLVVEAAADSGSLLTAASALEYGRDVFAVPGPINSEASVGTNRLIKMGAKLVSGAEDILEELQIPTKTKEKAAREILPETPEEAAIYALINQEPIYVDDLIQKSGLDTAVVNSTLILMEMKGMIRNIGGGNYIKV